MTDQPTEPGQEQTPQQPLADDAAAPDGEPDADQGEAEGVGELPADTQPVQDTPPDES